MNTRKHIIILLFSAVSFIGLAETSNDGYRQRQEQFLLSYAQQGDTSGLYGIFRQLSRVGAGLPLEEAQLHKVLATIRSNRDCNDFALNGLLRLVYLDREKPCIPQSLKPAIEERILDFKYWWDDQRRDTTYRCYHTENHQALYHTAELLAGQLYPARRFADGHTGKWHIEHALTLLRPWLEYRFRFGFSEWLSTYYDAETLVLANLYDYARDKRIRTQAHMVLDLLCFDLALNNYHGYLGSTSGRTYVSSLLSGSHNTSPVVKLLFDVGSFDRNESMGAVALSTGSYRCPRVIADIATDYTRPLLNRQRVSLNVEDAPQYGLTYTREEDCPLFWGMQEFIHPLSINLSKTVSHKYDVWPYRNYDDYIEQYNRQIEQHGRLVDMHLDRFALSEAQITTLRTRDYMLSCASDYRPGAPGYQQHIWQATLSDHALVYTNHPGSCDLRRSPNYWAGNEILPRAAMQGQVVVCIYQIPEGQANRFSHAYFPVSAFDEVLTSGHWTFGRKGDGYVALWSSLKHELRSDCRGERCDLVADGPQCVWVCEVGSESQWGSFDRFVQAITQADIQSSDHRSVCYHSPSEGSLNFGWDTPLTVDRQPQSLRGTYRYDNPYCQAPFASTEIVIENGKRRLILNYEKGSIEEVNL